MPDSSNIRLLIATDWFSPGYKAGGPIQSCVNLALALQDERAVYVLTSDRDLGDAAPYPGIKLNTWIPFDRQIQIMYLSPEQQNYFTIRTIIKALDPSIIYLNSMFSLCFSMFPLWAAKLKNWSGKLILIPRGMLRPSALDHKPLKKKIFLHVFRILNLHHNLCFHATDPAEAADIRREFGQNLNIVEIKPINGLNASPLAPIVKESGRLNLLFVGRIHPIKNLDYLLEHLANVPGEIELTVIGSKEDRIYYQRCQDLAAALPSSIKVFFVGEVPNQGIRSYLQKTHFFVLPTKGENYGHAIAEALSVGRPVLISDQTPWKNLEIAKAGWDFPLNDDKYFIKILEIIVTMNQEEYLKYSLGSGFFFEASKKNDQTKSAYLNLFS